MKALINKIALLALMFVASGCSYKCDNMTIPKTNSDVPTDIPFSEYSFSEPNCKWTDLSYPHKSEVVVINSYQELENFIICTEKSSIPIIDFSKHTLLLARGIEPYNIYAAIKSLQQLSAQDYVMSVELDPNLAAVVTNWQVAIITRKLAEGDKVLLQVI
ncbi:MAG: hypothetical protein RSA67_07405 [Alistipes sp.]